MISQISISLSVKRDAFYCVQYTKCAFTGHNHICLKDQLQKDALYSFKPNCPLHSSKFQVLVQVLCEHASYSSYSPLDLYLFQNINDGHCTVPVQKRRSRVEHFSVCQLNTPCTSLCSCRRTLSPFITVLFFSKKI